MSSIFRRRHTQSPQYPGICRTVILVGMTSLAMSCVLLADRHHQLIECVRDMLETEFATLFIVANESSLAEGVTRLQPRVVIVDLSLVSNRLPELLHQIRSSSPHTKLLLLSVHDQASIAQWALEAGADGVVLKRSIAADLHPAIDAVLGDRSFVSPGIPRVTLDDRSDSTTSSS
jgi:DNA-binding NarL/FixJ family response regulator